MGGRGDRSLCRVERHVGGARESGRLASSAGARRSAMRDERSDEVRAIERDAEHEVALDLTLTNTSRWMAHGRDGYSRKGREIGNASAYYSLPRLVTRGTLAIDGRRYEVTGSSWMDHEFGSSVLEADQVGWDWFGLQFDDGRELMLYQMRRRDGSRDPFSSGTLIEPRRLDRAALARRLHAGAAGDMAVGSHGHDAIRRAGASRFPVSDSRSRCARPCTIRSCTRRVRPNVTYWEGAVESTGGVARARVRGADRLQRRGVERRAAVSAGSIQRRRLPRDGYRDH